VLLSEIDGTRKAVYSAGLTQIRREDARSASVVSTARNINQQNSRKDEPRYSPEEAEHDKRDHEYGFSRSPRLQMPMFGKLFGYYDTVPRGQISVAELC
jgi:hypothetical protein